MADWIQMDSNLETKPEFRRLVDVAFEDPAFAGIPDWAIPRVVTGLLKDFWCWADSCSVDGVFPKMTAKSLARQHGGSETFWLAMAEPQVNWLEITDEAVIIVDWEERFSQSARRRIMENRRKSSYAKRKPPAKSTTSKRKKRTATTKTVVTCDAVTSKPVSDCETPRPKSALNAPAKAPPESESDSEQEKEIPDQTDQRGADQVDVSVSDPAEPKPPASRTPSVAIDPDAIAQEAAELFEQAGYRGSDGRVFWQAAAVLKAVGGITQAQAVDAARGARGSRNPPGYFRKSMRNLCPDFEDRIQGIRFTGPLPTGPPRAKGFFQLPATRLRWAPKGSARRPADVLADIENLERQELAAR